VHWDKTYVLLYFQEQGTFEGVITGVALSVVEQLTLKISCVCDAHRLVQRRPSGEHGDTENPLSVIF
jgi:hypothetical protein